MNIYFLHIFWLVGRGFVTWNVVGFPGSIGIISVSIVILLTIVKKIVGV